MVDSADGWYRSIASWWFEQAVASRPRTVFAAEVFAALRPDDTFTISDQTKMGRAFNKLGFRRVRLAGKVRRVAYVPSRGLAAAAPRLGRVFEEGADSVDGGVADGSGRYLYFVQSVNGGPVKIGSSNDVLARLRNLQIGSPYRLRLLFAVPVDVLSEVQAHAKFSFLRIPGGEWFEPGADLMRFIDEQILALCLPLVATGEPAHSC